MAGPESPQPQNPQESAPISPEAALEEQIEKSLAEIEENLEVIQAMVDVDSFADKASLQETIQTLTQDVHKSVTGNLVRFGALSKMSDRWKELNAQLIKLNEKRNEIYESFDAKNAPASAPEASKRKIEDREEIRKLSDVVNEYKTQLDEARKTGKNWDPRLSGSNGTVPLVELLDAYNNVKDISDWLSKSSSLDDKDLKKEVDTHLSVAKSLINDISNEVENIDNAEYLKYESVTEVTPLIQEINKLQASNVSTISNEARLKSEIADLDLKLTQIDKELENISPSIHESIASAYSGIMGGRSIEPLTNKKKDYWNKKKVAVKTEKDRRLNRTAEINAISQSKNEQIRNIKEIDDLISSIEQTRPRIMTWDTDVISLQFNPIYSRLNELKSILPEAEYRALEIKVLLADYRQTKRTLDATVTDHEMREVDFTDFAGAKKTQIFENKIYQRIESVINSVGGLTHPGIDAAFMTDMRSDYMDFKAEIEMRMKIYATEMSLDGKIWWNGQDGEKAERGLPGGATAYWDVDEKLIQDFICETRSLSTRHELRYSEERESNPSLTPRPVMKLRFEDASAPPERIQLRRTVNGEIMRILDRLYANKIPQHKDFYKTMHLKANSGLIPAMVRNIAITEYGVDPNLITEEQVKRVFYLHTLFLNHSMLMTRSAALSDTAYYANQFLSYALSEAKGGTNTYDLFTLLLVVGKYDDAKFDENTNPEGKTFIFDLIGRVDPKKIPEPKSMMGKVARAFTPINTIKDESLRNKMLHALHDRFNTEAEKFDYLADCPFVVVDKTEFDTYPFMPMPLQYMLFNDPGAYLPTRPDEKIVKRWGGGFAGFVGQPVTAADYVSRNGEILYEEIPWDNVRPESSILAWYNNTGNMLNLLGLFRNKSKSDLISKEDLAEMKKTGKYGATVLPQIGLEALAEKIRPDKLFDRFITIYLLGRSIYLLDNKKHLSDVEQMILEMVPVISSESADALITILKAGFGTKEAMQEYLAMFSEQVSAAVKYQS